MADPPATLYFCRAPSFAEALAQEPRLLAVPGVRRVALAFRIASELATDHIEGWIGTQLLRWERTPREPRATQAAVLAE